MKGKIFLTSLLILVCLLISIQGEAQAFIIINEILADPPPGIEGDANNDGVTSSTQDEMIEIFNQNSNTIDISGWSLHDALKPRHVFAADTLLEPQGIFVVFGGGTPNSINVDWVFSSSGSLGLNNSNETVFLYDIDNILIDSVSYGAEGGKDQSLVRSPEGYGDTFVKHLDLENADGARYSAGYFINEIPINEGGEGEQGPPNPKVPEMATIWYLALGGGLAFIHKRRKIALI
ncbi:MAG: lamin tail domain-containing protein [Candidatus Omnitrophica bacterium]|nr:lamin tail domain-containing protein [Candidatus Omnitrophota bacterium]